MTIGPDNAVWRRQRDAKCEKEVGRMRSYNINQGILEGLKRKLEAAIFKEIEAESFVELKNAINSLINQALSSL